MRYTEIRKQINELNMSPSRLSKFGQSTGKQLIGGFEAEVIFADAREYDSTPVAFDDDITRHTNLTDVQNFFEEYNSTKAIDKIGEAFSEWASDQASERASEMASEIAERMAEEHNADIEDPDEHVDAEHFRDDAFDEAYENAYDEDYSFYDWCQNEGYSSLTDLCYPFDLAGPMSEIDESEQFEQNAIPISQSLNRILGKEITISQEYHGDRTEGAYTLEPDGSIEPNDTDNDLAVEIVSPPLPLQEMLSDLEKTLHYVANRGGYTNESTGLHINLSLPDGEIDYVKLCLFSGDKAVLQQFDRTTNTYTKHAIARIVDKLQTDVRVNPASIIQSFEEVRKGNIKQASQSIMANNMSQKYTSVNFHTDENYIEFRSMGGDYLDRFPEIRNNVYRFAQALYVACDPNAYKKEYATKLYKMMSTTNDNVTDNIYNNAMKAFSLYSSGLMEKGLLLDLLSTRQTLRKGKKLNDPPKPNLPK